MSEELLALQNLSDRVSYVIDKHLMPLGHFTDRQQLFAAAESFYNKLVVADKYKPEKKLQHGVTLIKATSGTSDQSQSLGDDYGLSEVIFQILLISSSYLKNYEMFVSVSFHAVLLYRTERQCEVLLFQM